MAGRENAYAGAHMRIRPEMNVLKICRDSDSAPAPEELAASAERWRAAMSRGDFPAAWRETDRWEEPRRKLIARGEAPARRAHELVWDGSCFDGKRVLIRCEHGLGDTIQFLRFAPLLRQAARQVIVKAQPPLLDLLAGMDGIDLLLNGWTTEPEPEHDVVIECMELAYAFRSTLERLPAKTPYLPVDRLRRDRGNVLLGVHGGGFKIGVVWAASEWNPRRSIPLEQLAPLTELPVALYSFQQGPQRVRAGELGMMPVSAATENIADAAAGMLQMDAMVSVDSMTAHLAGALGVPVYLLLTRQADWRWMEGRGDSPWYPTMRILRQDASERWGAVVLELVQSLQHLLNDLGGKARSGGGFVRRR